MGERTVRYESLDRGSSDPIVDSEVVTLLWQVGPLPPNPNPWPAATPDAPQTSIELNGAAYQIRARLGGVGDHVDGDCLVELLVDGVMVDDVSVAASLGITPEINLYSPDYPLSQLGTSGHEVAVRVTNNTGGDVYFSDSDFEITPYLEVVEFYPGVTVPTNELCDELFVTQPNVPEIDGYTSSTAAPSTTYPTIGQAFDQSHLANEDFVVSESKAADTSLYSGWFADNTFELNRKIVVDGDTKIFQATSFSGAGSPDDGVSGSVEPSWPGSGTVVDNEITWTYVSVADNTGRNLLEKFTSGVGAEWGPDLNGEDVAIGSPMSVCVDSSDDTVWLLMYTNVPSLKLLHIDTDGTLLDSWTVAHDTPGSVLFLDVGTDGIACYTEKDAADGDLKTHLRAYDPATSTQKTSPLSFDPIDGFPQYLGAMKLLIGDQAGAMIVKTRYRPDTSDFITELLLYTKTGVEFATIPGVGANALCYAEDSSTAWIAASGSDNLMKADLTTLVVVDTLTISDSHNNIASCTNVHGDGFLYDVVTRRRPWVLFLG